jgi:hypothetical protein
MPLRRARYIGSVRQSHNRKSRPGRRRHAPHPGPIRRTGAHRPDTALHPTPRRRTNPQTNNPTEQRHLEAPAHSSQRAHKCQPQQTTSPTLKPTHTTSPYNPPNRNAAPTQTPTRQPNKIPHATPNQKAPAIKQTKNRADTSANCHHNTSDNPTRHTAISQPKFRPNTTPPPTTTHL